MGAGLRVRVDRKRDFFELIEAKTALYAFLLPKTTSGQKAGPGG